MVEVGASGGPWGFALGSYVPSDLERPLLKPQVHVTWSAYPSKFAATTDTG